MAHCSFLSSSLSVLQIRYIAVAVCNKLRILSNAAFSACKDFDNPMDRDVNQNLLKWFTLTSRLISPFGSSVKLVKIFFKLMTRPFKIKIKLKLNIKLSNHKI